jgi:hypothetical protein
VAYSRKGMVYVYDLAAKTERELFRGTAPSWMQ